MGIYSVVRRPISTRSILISALKRFLDRAFVVSHTTRPRAYTGIGRDTADMAIPVTHEVLSVGDILCGLFRLMETHVGLQSIKTALSIFCKII